MVCYHVKFRTSFYFLAVTVSKSKEKNVIFKVTYYLFYLSLLQAPARSRTARSIMASVLQRQMALVLRSASVQPLTSVQVTSERFVVTMVRRIQTSVLWRPSPVNWSTGLKSSVKDSVVSIIQRCFRRLHGSTNNWFVTFCFIFFLV